MEQTALIIITVILGLGILSQWIAWRIQWPSIVIMAIAGLLIGPVFGLINPKEALGGLYSPLISLAVAIILFEGSSSLDIREIKDISKSVFRVVTLGAFLAWIGGSLAAHLIAGLSLEISFIIGGLFVVTGPTVIIPLLRQAKLNSRTAAVLKWEGIIVDPAGPLLALLAYQVIKAFTHETLRLNYIWSFFLGAVIAALLGYGIGLAISFIVDRGMVPEYLKSPIILSCVLICFTIGEVVMHETGMLAVTVMGLTVGRTKQYVSSIKSIGHFVEEISVLLTSTIFILLTSSLTRETIADVFTLPIIGFVLVMLFLVRPLSIWLSTIGTELNNAEKLLIGWIAPRGIVALTVSGYFASILLEDGYADAGILVALTFALVIITVSAHGFTIAPLAKKLGLASTEPPGILIAGASSFSIALAEKIQQLGVPVILIDTSGGRLRLAEKKGLATHQGEILSEYTQYDTDLTQYETILVMTGDEAYNALVCQSYIPEFGYQNTFTLPTRPNSKVNHEELTTNLSAQTLFEKEAFFTELNRKINTGYSLRVINISEKNEIEKNHLPDDATPLFIKKKNDLLTFVTLKKELTLDEGDQLIVLAKESEILV
ncbi:cation:proton antiporter [Carnobacterium mobile]|uniref:cation:proton antiporter n=1 Tax=Carnobacterium mobile TaxID=2750 RepID=UPI0005577D42|nr:sodium:proton antiporter [Carnobacterium mobile]